MSTQRGRSGLGWVVSAVLVMGCSAADELDPDTGEQALLEQTPLELAPALVSCTVEADCTGGLACVAGTCQPCSGHAQCQSDVCNQSAATSMGPGACLPQSAVVYVDTMARPACETGDGSRSNPVCNISSGIARAIGSRYAVRVYRGFYFPFGTSGRTVYVFGPGDGTVVAGEEDSSVGAGITGPGSVVIDGVDIGTNVLTGVRCEGASLKVLRATIQGDYYGIRANNCQLELDRVRVIPPAFSGLTISGTGGYRISNSFFAGGLYQAVVLGGSATGTFQFNTVRGGGEDRPGGIDCGATSRSIRDSIVVGSFAAAGGAQTVGACVHQRVVVGSGDTRPDSGLIKIDPALDPNGRLLDTPANAACCIDRGARYVSSLYRDFFGTPRPQGASNDIGAHELR